MHVARQDPQADENSDNTETRHVPPGGRVADLHQISSAGSVEETLTWGSGCDKLQFCGESRADKRTLSLPEIDYLFSSKALA